MRAVTLALALAGCTASAVDTWAPRAAATLAVATLACDWHQTRSEAEGHWYLSSEANPILGETPSVARVDAYFAGIAAGTLALAELPGWWKWLIGVPAAVIISDVEIRTIRENYYLAHTVGCL